MAAGFVLFDQQTSARGIPLRLAKYHAISEATLAEEPQSPPPQATLSPLSPSIISSSDHHGTAQNSPRNRCQLYSFNTDGTPAVSNSHSSLKRVKDYILLETIGKGTFGKVKLAQHVGTKEKVAIKSILKANVKTMKQMNSVQREIRLMKLLHHPHIVQVKETLEDANQIFLVMEYAAGGDLYDFIKQHKPVSEETCRYFFRQILSAVDYCHKNSVIHRDLKPENCLIDDFGNIKIIDFGFGNTFHKDRTLDTYCGSPYYAAPEMIRGTPYVGPEVDIWSLGVILYAMLMGSLPFDHSDQSQMYSLILKGYYTPLENVSESVAKLIARILTVDPQQRAKMAEILNHPWTNLKFNSPPLSYHTEHPAVVIHPNKEAIAELVSYGIAESEVRRMLSINCGPHPIKSLYFLVDDYLQRIRLQASMDSSSADLRDNPYDSVSKDHSYSRNAWADSDETPRNNVSILISQADEDDKVAVAPSDLPPLPPKISLNRNYLEDEASNSEEEYNARYKRRSGVYIPQSDSDSNSSLNDPDAEAVAATASRPQNIPAAAAGNENNGYSKSPKDKILRFLRAARRSRSRSTQ
ncbi:hypothetical protein HDU97_002371 [Phlyctochytrium planicorne]|nr:hypothetical protein HDU97_002371 [Phlyctochytrium planicorne]